MSQCQATSIPRNTPSLPDIATLLIYQVSIIYYIIIQVNHSAYGSKHVLSVSAVEILLFVYSKTLETPPPAYSETGSPSPSESTVSEQSIPTPGTIMNDQQYLMTLNNFSVLSVIMIYIFYFCLLSVCLSVSFFCRSM